MLIKWQPRDRWFSNRQRTAQHNITKAFMIQNNVNEFRWRRLVSSQPFWSHALFWNLISSFSTVRSLWQSALLVVVLVKLRLYNLTTKNDLIAIKLATFIILWGSRSIAISNTARANVTLICFVMPMAAARSENVRLVSFVLDYWSNISRQTNDLSKCLSLALRKFLWNALQILAFSLLGQF